MNGDREAGITRRQFGVIAGGTLASLTLTGAPRAAHQDHSGRFNARPRSNVTTTVAGERKLGLEQTPDPMFGPRDGLLHLPEKPPTTPMPRLVLFHGASSSGETQLRRFSSIPDELGMAVLSPDSRTGTWDGIRGEYSRDISFIDRALQYTFGVVNVDPERIAVGGFSDGATYALAIGLLNGDLFKRVVAFSPGFLIPSPPPVGKPKFFISHGTSDRVLPIDKCSRVIVPELRSRGYDVTYREFDGIHEAPEPVAREGFSWLAARAAK
jgi:phospholipase/carboxylesterase